MVEPLAFDFEKRVEQDITSYAIIGIMVGSTQVCKLGICARPVGTYRGIYVCHFFITYRCCGINGIFPVLVMVLVCPGTGSALGYEIGWVEYVRSRCRIGHPVVDSEIFVVFYHSATTYIGGYVEISDFFGI